MLKKHTLVFAATVAFATASAAYAQDVPAETADAAGFYGGISLRTAGREGDGVTFGHLTSVWSRFALPVADDGGARTLAYGGYRWANDLAVEAALGTIDRYSLQPLASGGRRGVGLALASDSDTVGKAWNVDVFGTWEFRKSMSLYGRLGYAQADAQTSYAPGFVGDARRSRDGVNYALGLRLEYARFGRMPGEVVNGVLPENDQLQFGVQFRF